MAVFHDQLPFSVYPYGVGGSGSGGVGFLYDDVGLVDDDVVVGLPDVVDRSVAVVGAASGNYLGVAAWEFSDLGSSRGPHGDVSTRSLFEIAAVVVVVAVVTHAEGNGAVGETESDVCTD